MNVSPEQAGSNINVAISMLNSPENPFWDASQGIRLMRSIAVETKMNSQERFNRAQAACPYIEDLFNGIKSKFVLAKFVPGLSGKSKEWQAIVTKIAASIDRIKRDPQYAKLVYNFFPLIAQKYGSGVQGLNYVTGGMQLGQPRRSILEMKGDPLCKVILR